MSNSISLKEEVISALREVYDPEIPINVYDLGLIYEIKVSEENEVNVLMTLTSPTCPTADYIKEMINDAIINITGVKNCNIELTFEPAWTPDRVSMDAKEELGLSEPKEDLAVQSVFNNSVSSKQNLCFKCSKDDSKIPLLKVHFKGEEVVICNSCFLNF